MLATFVFSANVSFGLNPKVNVIKREVKLPCCLGVTKLNNIGFKDKDNWLNKPKIITNLENLGDTNRILEPTFMGIKIGGTESSFEAKLISNGFIKKNEAFIKKINNVSIEVLILTTVKSKLVRGVSIYYDEKTSWYSLKNDYFNHLESLTLKYGIPESSYEIFLNPYEEGDGYEMTAVKVDKTLYNSTWNFNNHSMYLKISKYCQVNLLIFNLENERKNEVEKKQNIQNLN